MSLVCRAHITTRWLIQTLHFLKGHTLLERISGADARKLTELVAKHLGKGPQPHQESEESEEKLSERIHSIMNQSRVVLFMKGEPDEPRCGFSRKAVNLLREQNVKFTHFDILKDEAVRQGDVMFSFGISAHSFDDDRSEEIE